MADLNSVGHGTSLSSKEGTLLFSECYQFVWLILIVILWVLKQVQLISGYFVDGKVTSENIVTDSYRHSDDRWNEPITKPDDPRRYLR